MSRQAEQAQSTQTTQEAPQVSQEQVQAQTQASSTPMLDQAEEASGGGVELGGPEAMGEGMATAAPGGGGGGGGADDGGDGDAAAALQGATQGGGGGGAEAPAEPSGGSGGTGGGAGGGGAGGGGAGGSGGGGAGGSGGGGAGGGGGGPSAAVELGGENGQAVMESFVALAPMSQARAFADLSDSMGTSIADAESSFQEELPEVEITVEPGQEGAEAGTIDLQDKGDDVGQDSPEQAPEPEMAETEDPGFFSAPELGGFLSGFSSGEGSDTSGNAAQIGSAISSVPSSDGDIQTSPGPSPVVPLEGESDPARVTDQESEAATKLAAESAKAALAVTELPGKERVKDFEFDESWSMSEGLAAVNELAPAEVPEDVAQVAMTELDGSVEAAIDGMYGAEMQGNLEGARAEMESAQTELDEGKQDKLAEFETSQAEELDKAQTEADTKVTQAKQKIADEKKATKDKQAKARAEAEGRIQSQRAQTMASIDAKNNEVNARVDREFKDAQKKAESEKAAGERKAEAEKKKAEKEAESDSWWDAAVDFVSDCLDALAEAVTQIFDAVRDAVSGIIDAVKELATTLIDAAVSFINDAIAAFGELLKSAVQGLLGEIFPELADALCAAIDDAVTKAQEAVTAVGESLKEGINALLDALKDGLNALLSVFEGLVQGALALATALMTGNWSEFLFKMLEGALSLAGISPDEFYAFVGRSEETIDIIVNDPGAFLGNCIDALGKGFGQFSDNFLDHLQAGFVDWMTGEIGGAGIEMPDALDMDGVFSIVLQVLGLDEDGLREKAEKHLGEDAVEMLEFVWGFVGAAIEGGLEGLWEHLQAYMGDLWDMVIGQIQDWLMEKVVIAAVTKIASMFNPVGAIVQAILMAWNLYTFIRDQIQRIWGVFEAVVNGIGDIARGSLGAAADMVEGSLANLVPVAIDLLAKLLGLGGLGDKVQEIVESVQEMVDEAIDKMVDKVKGLFRGGSDTGTDADAAEGDEQDAGSEDKGAFTMDLPKVAFQDGQGESHHLYGQLDGESVKLLVASETPETPETAVSDGGHMSSVDGAEETAVKDLAPTIAAKLNQAEDKEREAWALPASDSDKRAGMMAEAQKLKDEAKPLMNQLVSFLGETTGEGPEAQLRQLMAGFGDLEGVITNLPADVATMENDAMARGITDGSIRARAHEAWAASKGDRAYLDDVCKAFGDSVAERKLKEVDNDTQVNSGAQFAARTKDELKRLAAGMQSGVSVLSAMRTAANGLGLYQKGTEMTFSGELWRVTGFDGFWDYNVDASYKNDVFANHVERAAAGADLSGLDDGTQQALAREYVKKEGGWVGGEPTYTGKLGGGNGTTWWTDSDYAEAIDPEGKQSDLETFTKLCKLGALQPSWYGGGLARFSIDAGGLQMRKPTAYDGLMSEYWVQAENEEYWGVTGGGAREWVSPFVESSKLKTVTVHPSGSSFDTLLDKAKAGEEIDTSTISSDGDEAFAQANNPQQGGRTNEQYIRGEDAPGGEDGTVLVTPEVRANQQIGNETGSRQDDAMANGGNLTTGTPTTAIGVDDSDSDNVTITTKPRTDDGESFSGGGESHTVVAEGGRIKMASVYKTVAAHKASLEKAIQGIDAEGRKQEALEAMNQLSGPMNAADGLAKKLAEHNANIKEADKARDKDRAKAEGKKADAVLAELDPKQVEIAALFSKAFNILKEAGGKADGSEGEEADMEKVRQFDEWSKKSDEQLMFEVAQATWTTAVKKFAKDEVFHPLQRRILVFRQKTVDAICQKMASDHGVTFESMGSTNLTSDYDLSFGGDKAHLAVQGFNETFRKRYGKESGSVFDTNVYTKGEFLPDTKQVGTGELDEKTGEEKTTSETVEVDGKEKKVVEDVNQAKTSEGRKTQDRIQDVASLVKTRKFMNDKEWRDYKSSSLGAFPKGSSQADELKSRFIEAENLVRQQKEEVEERIARLDKEYEAAKEGRKVAEEKYKTAWQDMDGEEKELRAMNELYAEKLAKVADKMRERDVVRDEIKALKANNIDVPDSMMKELDRLTNDSKKLQSEALLFANEPYFSEGAIRHVVGDKQAGFDIKLAAGDLMASFNENLGDWLKDLDHYKHDLEVCAFRSSKYGDRLLDAGERLATMLKFDLPTGSATTRKLVDELYKLRKNDDLGTEAKEDASLKHLRDAHARAPRSVNLDVKKQKNDPTVEADPRVDALRSHVAGWGNKVAARARAAMSSMM